MTKVWPHPICAAVFDCDGVISDSIPIYLSANAGVIGHPLPPEIAMQTMGRCEKDVARIICERCHLKVTPEEFIASRSEILKTRLKTCPLVPGVADIIKRLHTMGIPMAVATSASRTLHDIKTSEQREIFDLFVCEISGNDVKLAKPDPEIFITAASRLGTFKPENVLVFEDALNGVKAANAAHMPCVLIDRPDRVDANVAGAAASDGASVELLLHHFSEFDFDAFTWQTRTH